jgi:hypothetical protein
MCASYQAQLTKLSLATITHKQCLKTTTINNRKLDLHQIRGMPVCTADKAVLGLIDKDIVRKAQDMDQGQNKCKGWVSF